VARERSSPPATAALAAKMRQTGNNAGSVIGRGQYSYATLDLALVHHNSMVRQLTAVRSVNREVKMSVLTDRDQGRMQDWANLVLAALLILSPWVLGFASDVPASVTAWISGIVIGVLAIAAIVKVAEWEEWVNFVLGIWLVIAPWVVRFAGDTSAVRAYVVIGVLVALASLWEIGTIRHLTLSHH
jgi:hypothetical protein